MKGLAAALQALQKGGVGVKQPLMNIHEYSQYQIHDFFFKHLNKVLVYLHYQLAKRKFG